jgi:hypothetical protein
VKTARLFVLLVLMLAAPWGSAGESPGEPSNLVRNPSFEDETAWSSRRHPGWHPFAVTKRRARTGGASAVTALERHPVTDGAQIWGAVQAFEIRKLPRTIGVWYRVEDWKQAVERQYAQVVVMIHDRRLERLTSQPQMQVRYVLAGLSEPPYPDPVNGRYIMAGPKKPKKGRWIHFERDLVADFVKAWGWYPENFQKLEIFLEARYDEPVPETAEISGEVYWDDVALR